jgi:hypothetical protein
MVFSGEMFILAILKISNLTENQSALLLLQCSLLPGGIILQGVLLLQGSMSVFACHYGYVPIGVIGLVTPSLTREEESITSYSCFSLGWGLLLALRDPGEKNQPAAKGLTGTYPIP